MNERQKFSSKFTCSCAISLLLFAILIGMITIHQAYAVSVEGVEGSSRPAVKKIDKETAPTLKAVYQKSHVSFNIQLPPVTEEEKNIKSDKGGPLQVGFGRNIPTPYDKNIKNYLNWQTLASGGLVTAFTVTSPGAAAIRIALRMKKIPQGTEIRFFSILNPKQIFGPFMEHDLIKKSKNKKLPVATYWSPVIEGETVGVEVYVPSSDAAAAVSFTISQVSHLVYSARNTNEKDLCEKDLSDIGNSGTCNIDVVCRTTTQVRNAVAKIIYTSGGSTYLCTGTLLNDLDDDSYISYFMTANHCVNTQEEADTIDSYWLFERQTCGGDAPTAVAQRTGGGELISTGATTDYSFLQLDAELPAGVYYSGWRSVSLAKNVPVTCIHHPQGDLKKWSQGSNTGFADYLGSVNNSGNYMRVVWSNGVTEGGSSGAPLFDSDYRFRGNLKGGNSSCSTSTYPDWYGRFDLTYPDVRPWLWVGPTDMVKNTVYTGTVASKASKEYKIVATSDLELKLYGLSQDADLYVRAGDRPTLDVYDCCPYNSGTAEETCYLAGGKTYYVRVRGWSDGNTSFSLQAKSKSLFSIYLPAILAGRTGRLGTGDLQVTLTWNTGDTDIDLHVIEPDGSHVYYNNQTGGSTAILDVDDRNGYGPENIFVKPGHAANGIYQVYVVYYRGSIPTTATIKITTNANSPQQVVKTFTRNLPSANRGLGYNVANIRFPSGSITETYGTR